MKNKYYLRSMIDSNRNPWRRVSTLTQKMSQSCEWFNAAFESPRELFRGYPDSISDSTIFAEVRTPGSPAPGWVPAPTK